MNKSRLESFTDAIFAIIMTIMVLELHTPEEPTLKALWAERVPLLAFIVSFLGMSNLWRTHHDLFKGAKEIDNRIFWSNMGLTLWVAFVPLTTSWVARFPGNIIPEFTFLGTELIWSFLLMNLSFAIRHDNPGMELSHITLRNWSTSTILMILGLITIPFFPFAGLLFGVLVVLLFTFVLAAEY